jgi:hypothetical protein
VQNEILTFFTCELLKFVIARGSELIAQPSDARRERPHDTLTHRAYQGWGSI